MFFILSFFVRNRKGCWPPSSASNFVVLKNAPLKSSPSFTTQSLFFIYPIANNIYLSIKNKKVKFLTETTRRRIRFSVTVRVCSRDILKTNIYIYEINSWFVSAPGNYLPLIHNLFEFIVCKNFVRKQSATFGKMSDVLTFTYGLIFYQTTLYSFQLANCHFNSRFTSTIFFLLTILKKIMFKMALGDRSLSLWLLFFLNRPL